MNGFILRSEYLPNTERCCVQMEGGGQWQMMLLPIAHLSAVIALVWF